MKQIAVIFTALAVEYGAVRSHVTDVREETHPSGNVYERGVFESDTGDWEIGIVQTRKGNVKAAVQTERAVSHFEPTIIIFLGVAGGIKDVGLGDVVVAEKVYAYDAGRDGKSFSPRPDLGSSSFRLVERAQAEARKDDWLRRIKHDTPVTPPHVFIGPIAAGEKVVASKRSDTYKLVQEHYGDALAVDMEDYGFLEAAHANPGVDAIVVRGISDLINRKATTDKLGWQEKAARNAAAFTFEILAKLSYLPATLQKQYSNAEEEEVRPRCKEILGKVISTEKQNTNSLLIDVESDCTEAEQYFLLQYLIPEIEGLDSRFYLPTMERYYRIREAVYRLLNHTALARRSWPLFLDQLDRNPRNYVTAKFFQKYREVTDNLVNGDLKRFTNVLVKAWTSLLGDYNIENVLAEATDRCWDGLDSKQKEFLLTVFFEIVCDRGRKENYPQKQIARKTIERAERDNRAELMNQVSNWMKRKIEEEYQRQREGMVATGRHRHRTIEEEAASFASFYEELTSLLKIEYRGWEEAVFSIYSDVWSSDSR
jgi:nucleoside phosphorylase